MLDIIRGPRKAPRRVLLYGTHGIGKSTWAAAAPSPIFLATEDGLNDVGCDRTPLLKSLGAVNSWVSDLLTESHGHRTVVIDTADWLERLIFNQVAAEHTKKNIEEIGYGKGYAFAMSHWEFLLNSFGHLRDKGMAVILLAHARVVKIEPPDADSYSRYEPDLHKFVSPLLQEWADEVLFASYRVNTIAKDEGFDRTRTRAIGTGDRIVYTCERPTHLAKRRIAMPDILPLDFNAYAACLMAQPAPPVQVSQRATAEPAQQAPKTPATPAPVPETPLNPNGDGNISGLVVEGSSKTGLYPTTPSSVNPF
jgi:hypothetical protein